MDVTATKRISATPEFGKDLDRLARLVERR